MVATYGVPTVVFHFCRSSFQGVTPSSFQADERQAPLLRVSACSHGPFCALFYCIFFVMHLHTVAGGVHGGVLSRCVALVLSIISCGQVRRTLTRERIFYD